ncbi:hypothetical protein F4553_008082 [Allocatelliglobosispora scoriae]|uniref:XRE family transcriptional regulator n=1 Tax=Allocatelliglobosispora scoriae TaxID=643052 RepID=A0A841C4D8_9ACTN|nr:helix-turn-helix transcriptional regulator [Allocatelliglobosispora scoriae]MBB5874648.1 hypothetical protein [Allocatelliglobosispora scoriae]
MEHEARVALGKGLRGLREPAFTQQTLALAINYSRSTVANVETARQRVPREFWIACDAVLATDGLLTRAHDDMERSRQDRQRAAAAIGFRQQGLVDSPPGRGQHLVHPSVTGGQAFHAPDVDQIAAIVWTLAAADTAGLDRSTIADALADLTDLSHAYGVQHRSVTIAQGAQTFAELQTLLKQAPRRTDRSDVHLAMALTSALMASAAFDLSHAAAATRLVRAARLFADQCGEPAVLAWVLGLTASFHNWQGRPSQALRETERGLALPIGTAARFRLVHIAARSQALLGNNDGVADLLRTDADLDLSAADPVEQFAGEFAFGAGRAAACAGAAWLDLGDGTAAAGALRHAIRWYRDSTDTAQAPLLGAQLDLVSAHVLADRPDAALQALSQITQPGVQHQIAVVRARSGALQQRIRSRPWRDSSQAQQLGDALQQWDDETRADLEPVAG